MTEKECRQGKWVNFNEAIEFIKVSKEILEKYNISYNNTLKNLFNINWDWTIAKMYISLNKNNNIELYTGIVYGDKKYEL